MYHPRRSPIMSELAPRKILHYLDDEFTDNKPSNLEYAILKSKEGPDIDFSVVLYRNFHFSKKNRSNLVNPLSLDEKRRPFAAAFLDELRFLVHLGSSSKILYARKIIQFISWINEHCPQTDFSQEIDIKKAYQEYTKWLFHRIKLKDGNKQKLKNNSASHLQKSARKACYLITGTSTQVVEFWTTSIRLTDRENFRGTLTTNPISDEDLYKTYTALCDFIHQTWLLLHKKDIENINIKGATLYSINDLYLENRRNELYNKAVIAAAISFIGASGANLQVVTEAEIDKFEQPASGKNLRLSGLKSRASNKVVHPEFAAKYLTIWKKWLDIRNDFLNYKGVISNIAFPWVTSENSITKIPNGATSKDKTLAKWLTKNYGVAWFSTRDWRRFKSKLLGKASDNDIFASAEMQGHSVKTAIRHYTNRSLIDASNEISFALNSIYESAISRTRNKSEIDANIIDSGPQVTMTSIGHCLSEDKLQPEAFEGFTSEAPQPNCRTKETCIFCDKYAIHADTQDIKKILSFKFVATALSKSSIQRNLEYKWAPYLHRVDEILRKLEAYQPSLKNEINKVAKDIEFGELDDFWMDYYEILIELGTIEQ